MSNGDSADLVVESTGGFAYNRHQNPNTVSGFASAGTYGQLALDPSDDQTPHFTFSLVDAATNTVLSGSHNWTLTLLDIDRKSSTEIIEYVDIAVSEVSNLYLSDVIDGLPTHLINICGTHGLEHTYVCLQPICTHELRAAAQC